MTAREVLLAAADYIEAHGGEAVDAIESAAGLPGGLCDLHAQPHFRSYCHAMDMVAFAIGRWRCDTAENEGNVYDWQHAPGRTRDEVVRALREAAR